MTEREEPEWKTRQLRIDKRLEDAGWEIVPKQAIRPARFFVHHALEEFPTQNGPADYALCAKGEVVGVVEAKKLSLGPQNVLVQAERYGRGVAESPFNFRGYRVPFLYSTNGEVIWFHDVRHELNTSRRVARFHTPNALRELLHRDFDEACTQLAALPNSHHWLRPYQIAANAAVERAIAARKRQMLLAMATGTGKTVTMVNEAYRLIRSGVGRRILFLVDRRALAAQAVRTFASFEPEPGLKFDKIYEVYSQRFQRDDFEDDKFDPKLLPANYLLDPQPGHTFVYVCTIQRMAINLFGRAAMFATGDEGPDDDADKLGIPIHAFDVIIADECHRGYTTAELSTWRNTLDHFDAIKIGLTATPAAHTKAYFNDVVYRYEYERAGVDIPDLEFIVFLRPVKSRILFEQMLGRGTRKGERYSDKSHFTVFDCFDGTLLAYFRQVSAFTAEPPDQPSRTIQEIIEDIWNNRDRAYNVRCLVKRLHRIDKEMSSEARELFAAFVDDGDLGRFAKSLPAALDRDFVGTMKLLRDPDFQQLLVNYPRPKRVFVVAIERGEPSTGTRRLHHRDRLRS